MKLLSVGSDAKTPKGEKLGYKTAIMYLAPFNLSGVNICPMAEMAKCHAPCLNTAGRGAMSNVQKSRLAKTEMFLRDRSNFFAQLRKELKAFQKKCAKDDYKPAVRLNGTSDIRWELFGIMDEFPDIQMYDYSKITNRKNLPRNYHITWSFSGANRKYAQMRPDHLNWAVVFDGEFPDTFLGRKVVNGDETDLRFLDPDGVVVGLKAKGKARKDTSGFVVRDSIALEKILGYRKES